MDGFWSQLLAPVEAEAFADYIIYAILFYNHPHGEASLSFLLSHLIY